MIFKVSRTAQTGEFLPSGSFMIRGKKNFLPSCQLQLGFGLLFRLDDESIERHKLAKETLLMLNEENKNVIEEQKSLEEIEMNNDENDSLEVSSESDSEHEFPDVEVILKFFFQILF